MKKQFSFALSLALSIVGLSSCGEEVQTPPVEEVAAKGTLQEVFKRLQGNNFSMSYIDNYAASGATRYQNSYYTEYSLQSDGDLGFNGYAQGDGIIFPYNIVDNEIVSGIPAVDSATGMRYENIYDYRDGLQNFDFTCLEETPSNDGSYVYTYGENENNDRLIETVFLRKTYNPSVVSTSLVFKDVSTNGFVIEAVGIDYGELGRDTTQVRVYNIGTTENTLIKDYLEDGGTSKTPLDLDFYRFIVPYLSTNTYKVTVDATNYNSGSSSYSTYVSDIYYTENAIYYDRLDDNSNVVTGQIETGSNVCSFTMPSIEADYLEITGSLSNPNSEDGFYYSLYGEYISYMFSSLNFTDFVGYVDEEHENSYILTDSYLQYILGYICYFEVDTNTYAVKELRMKINDYENNEFTLYFNIYNASTGVDRGVFSATFSNPGVSTLEAANRYLSIGDDTHDQTLDDVRTVLEKFKNHNYSSDYYFGNGLAKTFFTEKYRYTYTYGNPSSNLGYMNVDGTIKQFTITYNDDGEPTGINFSDSYNAPSDMTLPGTGTYQGASNDLFYLSDFSDAIYDYDSYQKGEIVGENCWLNTTSGFSRELMLYFRHGSDQVIVNNEYMSIYPTGAGFIVSNEEDPYDTRVTVLSGYVTADGSIYGASYVTYYDIENTGYDYIEKYISENNI